MVDALWRMADGVLAYREGEREERDEKGNDSASSEGIMPSPLALEL